MRLALVSTAMLTVATARARAAARAYTILDLGTIGGDSSIPAGYTALTNAAQVARRSIPPAGAVRAFRPEPNAPINPVTGNLGALADPIESRGYGINDAGQAVGV